MSGYFDAYFVEGYIDGSWVDFTRDIVSKIHGDYGVFGNQILDRVGEPGTAKFTLDNNASNSAGLVGYYSPGHENCRLGFKPGLKVRIRFVLDGYSIKKWEGKIPKDGIEVTSGNYSNKTVQVTVKTWFYIASKHEIKGIELATNKTIMQGVPLVLANMPASLQPPGTIKYYTGESVFPTLFDINKQTTTALSEFGKMAQSEIGFIYETRHGLVVEGRLTRNEEKTKLDSYPKATSELGLLINENNDFLVNEDGKRILISNSTTAIFDNVQSNADLSYGDGYYNSAKFRAYPRRVDAAATTILFTLQSPMYIGAGESVVISGGYSDPTGVAKNVSGTDIVTPFETPTHYQAFANNDGTGTDLSSNLTVTTIDPVTLKSTIGTADFKVYILNSGDAGYITKFNLVGRGIYANIPVDYYEEDAADIEDYEPSPLVLDMKYQADPYVAKRWAQISLFQTKTFRYSANKVHFKASIDLVYLFAFLYLEPGHRPRFKEDVTGLYSDFFIQGVSFDILLDGSLEFFWVLRASGLDTFNFVRWSPTSTPVPGYGTWDDPVYGWDF